MYDFKPYRRKQIAQLAPWEPGYDMTDVSVSAEDAKAGSPKAGDMIARNPKNHADQWLVAAAYFADNFESVDWKESLNDWWPWRTKVLTPQSQEAAEAAFESGWLRGRQELQKDMKELLAKLQRGASVNGFSPREEVLLIDTLRRAIAP